MILKLHKWNGKTLEWPHLWNNLGFARKHDSLWSKWIVTHNTPDYVVSFVNDFGYETVNDLNYKFVGFTKSQLAVVCLNAGFAKLVVENDPELAVNMGIAERNQFPYIVALYKEKLIWRVK